MIYLNNAATSFPKPSCVTEAVQACLTGVPEAQFRGGADAGKKDVRLLCRSRLGKLLGIADTDRIFFTSGATESLNTILCGLAEPGEILATQTEHNSVLRPLMNQRQKERFPVKMIPCTSDGEITEEALESAVTERSRFLVVNHCSNVTGMVQDMEKIGAFAKENGLFFVADVSQSAGCLPVEADRWGVDALAFTGHKGLFGMQGSGGFYIRSGYPLIPLKYGGTGRNSEQLSYGEKDYEYEAGTQNLPGIASLAAGAGFLLDIGLPVVMERERRRMGLLYRGLEKQPGVTVYGSWERCRGPVMSFNIRGLAPSDAAYILWSGYGIAVRAGLHCAPLIHEAMGTKRSGTVRASVSYFTTEEEVRMLLDAVEQIAASMGRESKETCG